MAGCGLLFALLIGCGGSSSGSGAPPEGEREAPSLTFSAAHSVVAAGDSTTLSWEASHASGCEASGGWDGERAASGSEEVGPITAVTDFRLSCSGANGSASRQLQVQVSSGGASIDLRAESTELESGDTATLVWTTVNANECTASGGWSGTQPLSGRFTTEALEENTTFQLSCSGPDGNAIAAVSVEMLDRMLRWVAPTQNVDGSPLTDLAGYVVYWGTQSGNYTGSHRIDSASVTEWEIDLPPGRYFFALTAVDADGMESGYSNELLKVIP